jgi:hypothetical protein
MLLLRQSSEVDDLGDWPWECGGAVSGSVRWPLPWRIPALAPLVTIHIHGSILWYCEFDWFHRANVGRAATLNGAPSLACAQTASHTYNGLNQNSILLLILDCSLQLSICTLYE